MISLTPSLEDYLESILIMEIKEKVARVRDIAQFLNVRTASVIGALKVLSEKGLVVHERYGYVELTPQGRAVANEIYGKHKTLVKFLHGILGIDLPTATEDACKIEHFIHRKSLERINKFIEFIESCPEGVPSWLSSFKYFAKHNKRPEPCPKGRR